MTIKNILAMVRDNKPNAEWLKSAANLTEIAKGGRQPAGQKYEKLERLDCRKLDGSEEEPVAVHVKAMSDRKSVKTENMRAPMNVFEAEVIMSNSPSIKAGSKYSIWENTTVLADEMAGFAQRYGDNGSILGKEFLIASYGTVPSKKRKNIDVYIFRVIPMNQ